MRDRRWEAAVESAVQMMGECAAVNPDYPGEYHCTYPMGHGPIPFEGSYMDHAAPEAGAWWNMPVASEKEAKLYDSVTEVVARVIREHVRVGNGGHCDCGWVPNRGHDHAQHVAVLAILAFMSYRE